MEIPENEVGREVGALERHGQTVIASLILVAVIWVGKTVTDQQATLATLLSRLVNVERALDNFESRFYPRDVAEADKETTHIRLREIERRLGKLER